MTADGDGEITWWSHRLQTRCSDADTRAHVVTDVIHWEDCMLSASAANLVLETICLSVSWPCVLVTRWSVVSSGHWTLLRRVKAGRRCFGVYTEFGVSVFIGLSVDQSVSLCVCMCVCPTGQSLVSTDQWTTLLLVIAAVSQKATCTWCHDSTCFASVITNNSPLTGGHNSRAVLLCAVDHFSRLQMSSSFHSSSSL